LTLKYSELQTGIAPSPVGEGWGEENKIKTLAYSPHPTFSLWRRLLDLCRYLRLFSKRGASKNSVSRKTSLI